MDGVVPDLGAFPRPGTFLHEGPGARPPTVLARLSPTNGRDAQRRCGRGGANSTTGPTSERTRSVTPMRGRGPGRRATVATSSSAIGRVTHRAGRGRRSPGHVSRWIGGPLTRSTRAARTAPDRRRTGLGVARRAQCALLAVDGPGPAVLRHERSVAVLRARTACPCRGWCAPVLRVDPPTIGQLVPSRLPGRRGEPGAHPGLTPTTTSAPPGPNAPLARWGRHRWTGGPGARRSPVVSIHDSRARATASW